MSVYKINDIFSKSELETLYGLIDSIVIPIKADGTYLYDTEDTLSTCTISRSLGRLQASFKAPDGVCLRLFDVVKQTHPEKMTVSGATYVEYSKKYGTPDLPPHFDGDGSDLIVNYQVSSNTSWDIGVNLETYNMEDNSALVFDPNKNIHWRTHKDFKKDEYVRMIFFRLQRLDSDIDNSHLRYSLDHEIYKDVNAFRDSL